MLERALRGLNPEPPADSPPMQMEPHDAPPPPPAPKRPRWLLALISLPVIPVAFALLRVAHGAAEHPQASVSPQARGRVSNWMRASDLERLKLEDNRASIPLKGGKLRASLTLNMPLQRKVKRTLERYEVPFASLVALEPVSGKVLAYVNHSSANPRAGDLARDPSPPAASIFKIVTTAALLRQGVDGKTKACVHDSLHGLDASHLKDIPSIDKACIDIGTALANSTNAVFAKLATRRLKPAALAAEAKAFGFGQQLPFDFPWNASPFDMPKASLEYARMSAGFWHSQLSPLHAATLAATIANDGVRKAPFLVARIDRARPADSKKQPSSVYRYAPSKAQRVLSPQIAAELSRMMRGTVRFGTAKSAFFDRKGRPFLPGIEVAGKTGTLSSQKPYRGYTWWVGFAPAEAPRIAVAALVVNTPKWRIKASFLAREALRAYLR